MSSKQHFALGVLTFVLLLVVVVGGYAHGIVSKFSDVMQSPAATSKFEVDADIMLTASQDGNLRLEYIRFNRMSGEVNSKILDLLLLLAEK